MTKKERWAIKFIEIGQYANLSIQGTWYPAETKSHGVLLYLHGGGLIYGQRDDLPETYVSMINQAQFDLLTLDYLLAPESTLSEIVNQLEETLIWWIQTGFRQLKRENNNFYLFGRSAGAYLSLLLASKNTYSMLEGIVSFYGYYNLNDPAFLHPNRYYLNYPKVNPNVVPSLIGSQPTVSESLNQRFPIYLSGRQHGNWLDILFNGHKDLDSFSISQTELSELPPLFLTHANNDQDVPRRQAQQVKNYAQDVTYMQVDSREHDFDRTDKQTLGIPTYQSMSTWLIKQIGGK